MNLAACFAGRSERKRSNQISNGQKQVITGCLCLGGFRPDTDMKGENQNEKSQFPCQRSFSFPFSCPAWPSRSFLWRSSRKLNSPLRLLIFLPSESPFRGGRSLGHCSPFALVVHGHADGPAARCITIQEAADHILGQAGGRPSVNGTSTTR
jgi:hypothetical protein